MCATLQLFFALDGELGDHHDNPVERKPHAVSIYISITASRVGSRAVFQHASFILVMIFLAARSFRSSNFPSFFQVLAWTILTEAVLLGVSHRFRLQESDKEYRCMDLKTGYVEESADQTPNDYCFNILQSRTHCPHGKYLCQFQQMNPGWQTFLKLLYAWRFAHKDSNSDWKDFMRSYGVLPKRSNEIQPKNHKLCVLLPYRDGCQRFNHAKIGERAAHLKMFLAYMQDFLTSVGHLEFDFIIVAQTDRGHFNKGALYNSGANAAVDRGCDFIALHDIDHLPTDHRNRYHWPDRPIHLCTNTSALECCETDYVGGAVLMQLKHFVLMNGMSNAYHGWGAEDADLYNRIFRVFGSVRRLDQRIGHYFARPHARDRPGQETATKTNLHTLKMQVDSKSRSFMDTNGFMQLLSQVSIVNISESHNLVRITVEILKNGERQAQCENLAR